MSKQNLEKMVMKAQEKHLRSNPAPKVLRMENPVVDGKVVWDFEFKFVIFGRPVVQKNGMEIVWPKGRKKPALVKNAKVKAAHKEAVRQLKKQWAGATAIPAGVLMNAAIVSYQGKSGKADASNLYEAPQDALQAAGIIENDYWIKTHDGSDRRMDAENPRVEITLTAWMGEG